MAKFTLEQAATEAVRELRNRGFTAYFAGGSVRDSLLGRPSKDVDIATDALPEQVVGVFPKSFLVGAHFGVVLIKHRSHHFEVATFRTASSYGEVRGAVRLAFSSPQEDAQRRDFTINGLFFDPIAEQVVDYVHGQQDLAARLIRGVGNPRERFAEDYLRLLRAIRFAVVLDFQIEPQTWLAMLELSPKIQEVSADRVKEELRTLLLHPSRGRAFQLLEESGLLSGIFPELATQDLRHMRGMLSHLPETVELSLPLAIVLHALPDSAESVLRGLRFPNEVVAEVVTLVANQQGVARAHEMGVAEQIRFMSRPTFLLELELFRVRSLAEAAGLDAYHFLLQKWRAHGGESMIPPRLVNGRQLLQLGCPSGVVLGQMLEDIQTLQLEGKLHTEAEALAWAGRQIHSS